MNKYLKTLLTVALSGGAAACGMIAIDPAHMDFKHVGTVFAGGSVLGLINWLRNSPWGNDDNGKPNDQNDKSFTQINGR
jgi:hypothetical protein